MGKKRRAANSVLHTIKPVWRRGRRRIQQGLTCRGRDQTAFFTVTGSLIRTPSTGCTWPGRKKMDCSLGRQRSHNIVVRDSTPADCIERVVSMGGDNFISETLHASASSEDSFQRCLEISAAAATTAAARHTVKHRETCSGAEPRHLHKQRETACGGGKSILC